MTGTRFTLGLLAVCALVMLSGCGMEDQVWDLSVNGNLKPVDDEFVFNGTVELGGKTGNVTVHDVRVKFVAADNTTIKSVRVGRLNDTDRLENIIIRLNQKPQYVQVTASHVESPENARYGFSGLTLTEDGDYRPYYQNTTTTTG
jgi:hypothetical protein